MRRWLVIVVLLLIPWSSSSTFPTRLLAQDAATRRDSARLHVDAGLTLAAAGDTAAALAELNRAIAADPDLAEAHFQFGRLLALQAGSDSLSPERHAAEAALLKAVALDPDNNLYLVTLVRLRGERRMTAEGKRVVDDLLRPGRGTRLLDPDSMVLVETAKAWVREFEELRARNFPRRMGRHRCDELIGETCLAYVEVGSSGPREPIVVDSARRALLEKLAVASQSLHGDQFILSQRVRYLVEAGRHGDALALARSCGLATGWWCEALGGYVFHSLQDFQGADSAFALALQDVPVRGRRWWTDVGTFLDGELKAAYDTAFGFKRDSLERRFWWLADPLYLTPVNDRRTEHMARNVVCWLQGQAPSGHGLGDGDALRQIVLRHGWPMGWVISRATPESVDISAVYAGHRRQFLPRSRFVVDPSSIRPGEWSIGSLTPFETYAPTYVSEYNVLEHQLAIFPHGDSAVVVAAFDQSADPGWRDTPVEVALFLARDELSEPIVVRPDDADVSGVLDAIVGAEPYLLSFEMFSSEKRRAARVRYGIHPRKLERFELAVSDLLITSSDAPLPNSLGSAAPRARGSLRVRAGEKLGVFWEVYGLGPDAEGISLYLALQQVGEGEFGRLDDMPLSEKPPLGLGWEEIVPAYTRIWPRSLSVDLPADLTPGLYALYVVAKTRDREAVRAARALLVERD
jgi:hypothetical protein